MRKQTKVAALVSAAALLAIGASMTSFAAGWTTDDNGEPTYEDSNGEVDPGFHKNPKIDPTRYYFIDDNGAMRKSEFVDYGDATYYIDSTGARARYHWVNRAYDGDELINGTTPEEVWYYVDANGQIVTAEGDAQMIKVRAAEGPDAKKKPFVFDSDGIMLTGWVELDEGWVYCDPVGTNGRVLGEVVMNDFIDLNALEELSEDFMDVADNNDPDEDGKVWVFCAKTTGICTINPDGGNATKELKWDSDKRYYTFNDYGILNEETWVDKDGDPLFPDEDGKVDLTAAYYFAGEGGELKEGDWKTVQAWYEDESAKYYFKGDQTRAGAGLEDGQVVDLWLNKVHYLFGSNGKQVADKVVRADVADVKGYDPGTGTDNNITEVTASDARSKAALNTLNNLGIFYLGKDGKILKGAAFDTDNGNGYATKKGSLAGLDVEVKDGKAAYAIIDGKLYQKKNGVDPYYKLVKNDTYDYVYVEFGSQADVAAIFYDKNADQVFGEKKTKDSKNTYKEGGSVYSNWQPYNKDGTLVKKGKGAEGKVRLVIDANGNLVKVTDEVVYSADGKDFAYLTTNKYGVVTKDTTNGED